MGRHGRTDDQPARRRVDDLQRRGPRSNLNVCEGDGRQEPDQGTRDQIGSGVTLPEGIRPLADPRSGDRLGAGEYEGPGRIERVRGSTTTKGGRRIRHQKRRGGGRREWRRLVVDEDQGGESKHHGTAPPPNVAECSNGRRDQLLVSVECLGRVRHVGRPARCLVGGDTESSLRLAIFEARDVNDKRLSPRRFLAFAIATSASRHGERPSIYSRRNAAGSRSCGICGSLRAGNDDEAERSADERSGTRVQGRRRRSPGRNGQHQVICWDRRPVVSLPAEQRRTRSIHGVEKRKTIVGAHRAMLWEGSRRISHRWRRRGKRVRTDLMTTTVAHPSLTMVSDRCRPASPSCRGVNRARWHSVRHHRTLQSCPAHMRQKGSMVHRVSAVLPPEPGTHSRPPICASASIANTRRPDSHCRATTPTAGVLRRFW